jgi:hypothetical protein
VSCKHFWSFPHSVFEGRTPSEVGVVRYCSKCKKVQMAFTRKWGKIPKEYDISDVMKEMRS